MGVRGAVDRAAEIAGGFKALACAIGVSASAPAMWRARGSVPPAYCARLEQAAALKVRRWHLRPTDWHLIWPELAGTAGAPPVHMAAQPPEQLERAA
jgi:DNA-binding transcriptional regulator YdaS (Cro superfamily)